MSERRVIMDYPTAWAYVRSRALSRGIGEHDPTCSFRQTNGAILCDCDVLNDEYNRRRLARCDHLLDPKGTTDAWLRCVGRVGHTEPHWWSLVGEGAWQFVGDAVPHV